MADVHKLGSRLATFFCEDPSTFKLGTSLQLISKFVSRVRAAKQVRRHPGRTRISVISFYYCFSLLLQENEQRKLREEREEKRRLQKEEDDKKKKAKQETAKAAGKPPEVSSGGCVDRLLSGIRGGSKLRDRASLATSEEPVSWKRRRSSRVKVMTKGVVDSLSLVARLAAAETQSDGSASGLEGQSQAGLHTVANAADEVCLVFFAGHIVDVS